jgi:hypothetical protein
MTYPYDWKSVHQVALATHSEWYAGTLDALLNVGPYTKEGDRGYVEECLAWVTRRTITLTDGSTVQRWVPDAPMWGGNDLAAGAGAVPVGTVSTEGVWTIAADYDWVNAAVNKSYSALAISFTTTASHRVIGAAPRLTDVPAYVQLRCLRIDKTNDANHAWLMMTGGGTVGGLGGGGGFPPDGGNGSGLSGLTGPLYLISRGGGGGSGGLGRAGAAGGAGGGSDTITGAMLQGRTSTNAVGAAPSGNNGGDANSLNFSDFHAWDSVVPGGAMPVGGGGGGGGQGNGGGVGGKGGDGGGILLIDAACISIPAGTMLFASQGVGGTGGTDAAGGSGGGGGGGGGCGGGGFCRLRYRRASAGAGAFSVSAVRGQPVGGPGNGDGVGSAGGAGGSAVAGIALTVVV